MLTDMTKKSRATLVCTRGVPQGSGLEQVNFSTFINDLNFNKVNWFCFRWPCVYFFMQVSSIRPRPLGPPPRAPIRIALVPDAA